MSKKPNSKSIIANFGALSSTAPEEPELAADEQRPAQRTLPRVGAGIIGATQRSLAEIREERDRLLALVESGAAIQEIDPDLIEPSPFPDRLADDDAEGFEEFKNRFEAEGQQVPVQLRPHPSENGKYQVIFGHRRWRAARELGRHVKAVITKLTDSELVIAQGIENSDRQDLTWIERALFAMRMDEQGIKPRDIKAALSIDDAELARLRQVHRSVPIDVIESIGRAPKIGRPRWVSFAQAVQKDSKALARVRKTLSADKVISSDERFQAALSAVLDRSEVEAKQTEFDLRDAAGAVLAKATFRDRDIRLKLSKDRADAFGEFMQAELPKLVERFLNEGGDS